MNRQTYEEVFVDCFVSFVQYNETADYVHRCFNGTLVQANNINKQVLNFNILFSPLLSTGVSIKGKWGTVAAFDVCRKNIFNILTIQE